MVVEAVKLASKLHSRQRKKKSIVPDIPYMGHLMEVAGIVQANGGDETTVAAALLHDVIEDQGAGAREEICEKLVETASLPALLVIVADKLQNSRALLRRLKLEGAEGWGSPSRKEKLWYMHNLLEAMRDRLTRLEQEADHPTLVSVRLLIDEYAEVVATLTRY
jgi:hypothetical protein